jgi:hypothetical protein
MIQSIVIIWSCTATQIRGTTQILNHLHPLTPSRPKLLLKYLNEHMEMLEVFREGFKIGPMLAPPASSSGETQAHCLKALAELEDRIKVIQHILEASSPAKIDIEEVKRLLDEQEAMYNQLQLRYLFYHAHIFVELEEIGEAQEMVKLAMKTAN